MKVLIIYHSEHHGNTKKGAGSDCTARRRYFAKASDSSSLNCPDFDLIGFAYGIYYQKFPHT